MIKVDSGHVIFEGNSSKIIAEFCIGLNTFYHKAKRELGKEFADTALVGIGRYAVTDDENTALEDIFAELIEAGDKQK